MATDAKFDRIQKIIPHTNADSLEIAIVSNFPCIVKKGEFKVGEIVFYIRDDAKLIETESYKDWVKESSKPGVIGPMEYTWTYPWQESFIKYVGTGGRVKTIKLRGSISMGIILKADVACPGDSNLDEINSKILDSETGEKFLMDKVRTFETSPLQKCQTREILRLRI